MNWDANRIQAGMGPVGPVQPGSTTKSAQKVQPGPTQFHEALQGVQATPAKQADVTISAHAGERLLQRGITLDRADLEKISAGMDRATEKGARESLFLLRDLAMIVSVENRTVITALQGDSAKENVYTKIDSAVLL